MANNPRAFPRPYSQHDDSTHMEDRYNEQDGMTLRDYYAEQVILGMYASGIAVTQENEKAAAHEAWSQADAMLAARAEGGAS